MRLNLQPSIAISLGNVRLVACLLLICVQTGCWTPLQSHGIQASRLPDTFRIPQRTAGESLNFANLTIEPPDDYLLGPNDKLQVTVAGLNEGAETRPLLVQVMAKGQIHLPLVGAVSVGGKNLLEAQIAIHNAYTDGYLESPQVNIALIEKDVVSVLVLGKTNAPGVHILEKYANDVGHALAAAGGLTEDAADVIEIHRRSTTHTVRRLPSDTGYTPEVCNCFEEGVDSSIVGSGNILRIPLRTSVPLALSEADITLHDGDVVVVPSRRHEVFYVVGKLGTTNTVRFTVGDRERELGVGFVLPRDREIDVVTAVAMAGYIDPIDSPSTVTVQRAMPDGTRLLILVDLMEARYDPQATVLVEPGDIIYLNPDASWYMRRTIDRIFPDILLQPYSFFMRRSIVGRGGVN